MNPQDTIELLAQTIAAREISDRVWFDLPPATREHFRTIVSGVVSQLMAYNMAELFQSVVVAGYEARHGAGSWCRAARETQQKYGERTSAVFFWWVMAMNGYIAY